MHFFGTELQSYKVNLHTHSKSSDGVFQPDELIQRYSQAGYDALAFTDHRFANPVSSYDGKGMTLISGMEVHPQAMRGILWHMLALGLPEDFKHDDSWSGQQAADAILEAGGIFFIAHPYWCGFTSSEVMSIQGSAGIEVFNAACRYPGKGYSMQTWDECLDHGRRYSAIAVDDVHGHDQLFKGHTMICARDKGPESLLKALAEGSFYASQGPQFTHLSYENQVFKAKFSPCAEAILISNRHNGFLGKLAEADEQSGKLELCEEISIDLSKLPAGFYVRCQIRDSEGRYAWSNPVFL